MALMQTPSQGPAPAAAPAAPPDPQMQPGPAAQGVADSVDQSMATPEEQAAYDGLVGNALRVIYSKDGKAGKTTHESVMKSLRAGADPALTLSSLTASIIKAIDQQNNNAIPETVILPAAMEVMDAINELAETDGLWEMDANTAEVAVDLLVQDIAVAYGMTAEDVQPFMDQFENDELAFLGEEATRNADAWTPVKSSSGTRGGNGQGRRDDVEGGAGAGKARAPARTGTGKGRRKVPTRSR